MQTTTQSALGVQTDSRALREAVRELRMGKGGPDDRDHG
jgi:hypothetical protein